MKKNRLLSLLLVSILSFSSFAGCTKAEPPAPEIEIIMPEGDELKTETESSAIVVTDQMGREVVLEQTADTLVSSYYISTAILVSLGLGDNLVGIEAKADTRGLYQLAAPNLLDLPAIGSGKGVNVEEIAALNPDVVIIPLRLGDAVASFEILNIPVIVVNPETLEEFTACIELLAAITGTEDKAEALLSYYDEKMAYVAGLTDGLEERPSVYLAGGSDYMSTCTSKMYQNDLIALAGGDNVSKELEDGYWQTVSAEQLNLWAPEYLFTVSYREYNALDIVLDPALSEIPAVVNGDAFPFPSDIEPWDYPTPSSILGVLYMTHVLHPDLISAEDFEAEAEAFYQEFFGIEVTLEDMGI